MHTGTKTRSFVMLLIANWHLAATTSQFERATSNTVIAKILEKLIWECSKKSYGSEINLVLH